MIRDGIKRTTLADAGADLGIPRELFDVKLVDPYHAIQWLASGRFYSQPVEPVRSWTTCLPGEDEPEMYREAGRQEMAEEIVTNAIATGKLRCAFVEESAHQKPWIGIKLPRLDIIEPAALEGTEVSHSWDDGFTLQIVRASDTTVEEEDDILFLNGFLFFWDEVCKLSPRALGRVEIAENAEAPAPSPSLQLVRSAPAKSDSGRRGRRPRHYGGPIAAFLARAVSYGIDNAAREKDEVLGRWLIEEFQRVGDAAPPDIRNASADARGAIQTWVSAVTQNPHGAITAP